MPLSLTLGVFLSVLCDNLLLTVVVPILPELLREKTTAGANPHNQTNDDRNEETCLFHLQMLKEDSKLGILLSTKAIMQLICNPIVGNITLKIGYKYPLLFGNCVLLLCSLIFGFANSYAFFIIGRSCHGIASSAISVAGMALIAELYQVDEERTKFLGRIMSGAALGVLIGYPFGGLGYSLTGKTLPFMMIGALALFNTVIYIAQFRNQMEYEDHGEANAAQWLHKWHRQIVDYSESSRNSCSDLIMVPTSSLRDLLKDRSILIIAVAIWFSTTCMAILEPTLPIWLIETIDPPKWHLGIVFVPDSLGYFLGTNFFGQFAMRVGRWKLSMVSMSTIGVACLLLPFGNTILKLAVPHFMLGLGLGVIDASLMPLLARIADEKYHAGYGAVYALAQTSVALAYSFGPLIGGQLVGILGFPGLIRSLGVINLLYCPCLLYLANFENEIMENGQFVPYQTLQEYHLKEIQHTGGGDDLTSAGSISNSTSHASSILDIDEEENKSKDLKMKGNTASGSKKLTMNFKKVRFQIDQTSQLLETVKCIKMTVGSHPQPEYQASYQRFYDELD